MPGGGECPFRTEIIMTENWIKADNPVLKRGEKWEKSKEN